MGRRTRDTAVQRVTIQKQGELLHLFRKAKIPRRHNVTQTGSASTTWNSLRGKRTSR